MAIVDKREKEEQQMTERLKSSQEGRARLMYLMYLPIHDKANKIVAAYIVIVKSNCQSIVIKLMNFPTLLITTQHSNYLNQMS